MFACIAIALMLGAGAGIPVDPGAGCTACHLMRPQLETLRAGSHAKVASCPDCHEPHGNTVRRLYAVASDGLRHGLLATLGAQPAVIRIHRAGAEVVQANCIRCHGFEESRAIQANPSLPRPKPQPKTSAHADSQRICFECHRETSHPLQQRKTESRGTVP